jgi:IclR family pca regulon transcriptional regulator
MSRASARGRAPLARERPVGGRAQPRRAEPRPGRGPYYVEALGRGLGLLDCFVAGPAQLTLAELSERVGLTKGTTFRLLRTLEEAGYVRQDPLTKRYLLSLKMLDLQDASLTALEYPQVALPYLEELNLALGESVNMAVLDGTNVRYVARVASKRIMSVNLHVGSLLPAHATSMGKVLLAALGHDRVRELYAAQPLEPFTHRTIDSIGRLLEELDAVAARGYAVADEELELGLRSAAAPVRVANGRVVAAVNVSTATARISRERLVDELVPALLTTVAALSARLGWRGRVAPEPAGG